MLKNYAVRTRTEGFAPLIELINSVLRLTNVCRIRSCLFNRLAGRSVECEIKVSARAGGIVDPNLTLRTAAALRVGRTVVETSVRRCVRLRVIDSACVRM